MAKRRRRGQKKLRTREHVIAELGVNHVERYILRRGFAVDRVKSDYGIDLVMYTYSDSGEIENGDVRFQLKATDRLKLLKDGKTIACRVAYADLFWWSGEPSPVILVAYDAVNDQAHWTYVQKYLNSPKGRSALGRGGQRTVTLYIPVANRLDGDAIEMFRKFRDKRLTK